MYDHPSHPVYHAAALRIRDAIQQTMHDAQSQLPGFVLKQHWIAGKHAPSAWASVESWYAGLPAGDPVILRMLCDLKLLAEALACVTSVTTERETKAAPDLSLKRQKRVEAP